MNDFKNEKDTFSAISIKKNIASRFRKFSKNISGNHTETLTAIMDFFESNKLSPDKPLEFTMSKLESNIKKRINALIAIVRDIEMHQTKPTMAMLQLLFEQAPPKQKQPRLVEVKQPKFKQGSFATSLEAIELRKEKNTYKMELQKTRKQFSTVLNKVSIVKSSFGKTKLQLDLSTDEFEALKQKIESD